MGRNGVVSGSVASSLRLRSGMGLPVGEHIVPNKPLPLNDELVWDNGTPFPEPCIDRIADTIGKYEALAWTCGGLGFFATFGLLAVWNDKASKIPFFYNFLFWWLVWGGVVGGKLALHLRLKVPKVYPYDNQRFGLGSEP